MVKKIAKKLQKKDFSEKNCYGSGLYRMIKW